MRNRTKESASAESCTARPSSPSAPCEPPLAAAGPRITVLVDGHPWRVAVADLGNKVLTDACEVAESSTIVLDDLLDLADEDRVRAVDFAARLHNAKYRAGDTDHDDLLDAVLALDPGGSMRHIARWQAVAVEAAALKYPDATDVAAHRISDALRESGIRGIRVTTLAKSIKAIIRQTTPSDRADRMAQRVLEVLPDAPVSEQAVVPAGWVLGPEGIVRPGGRPGDAVLGPVLVVETGRDVAGGGETVTLAYLRQGEWRQRVVDRKQVADARSIVGLAEFGVPITSNCAKTLVQWLAEYEAANAGGIARVDRTTHLGWQAGLATFAWGRSIISRDAEARPIRFQGRDAGDEQLADAFHASGNLEAWYQAAAIANKYPRVLVGLYTAFVPPLLRILGVSSFVLSFAGETTLGKTTALHLAGSAWGYPNEAENEEVPSVVSTWNSTATWRERAPSVIHSLPFLLDDSKNVPDVRDVAKTVYSISQGRGKGRCTVDGIAKQMTWSTVLISTGEDPLLSFCRGDDGVRARVIELSGSPFGGTSPGIRRDVQDLNRLVLANYGHAGPAVVRYLVEKPETWRSIRKNHAKYVAWYVRRAGGNRVLDRMALILGAISTASVLVHNVLDLPFKWSDPVDVVWDDLAREVVDADRPREALRAVWGWAVAHRDNFWPPTPGGRDFGTSKRQPHDGWVGRWGVDGRCDRKKLVPPDIDESLEGDDDPAPGWIGFVRERLEGILREMNYEPEATIRAWRDRGWLRTDGDGRSLLKTGIDGHAVRLVAIRHDAVEQVCE